jgi:hypothetical protein
MKIALIILGAIAATVLAFFIRAHVGEEAVWRKLTKSVPLQPLTSAEIKLTNDHVYSRDTADYDQVGNVVLNNGDVWRFAFRSHHAIGGFDSFSVFSGPPGTFRVRGEGFCCEVEFSNEADLKDSVAFLASLRRDNDSVQLTK